MRLRLRSRRGASFFGLLTRNPAAFRRVKFGESCALADDDAGHDSDVVSVDQNRLSYPVDGISLASGRNDIARRERGDGAGLQGGRPERRCWVPWSEQAELIVNHFTSFGWLPTLTGAVAVGRVSWGAGHNLSCHAPAQRSSPENSRSPLAVLVLDLPVATPRGRAAPGSAALRTLFGWRPHRVGDSRPSPHRPSRRSSPVLGRRTGEHVQALP